MDFQVNHPLRCLLFCLLLVPVLGLTFAEDSVGRVKTLVEDAANQFKNKDLDLAGDRIEEALGILGRMADKGLTESEIESLKPIYPRLKKARELLAKEGILMSDMVVFTRDGKRKRSGDAATAVATTPKPAKPKDNSLSFAKQIAPILLRNCGGCHIQGSRGQLNFASYSALTDSTKKLVVAGEAMDSHLLQVIESQQMPPQRPVSESDVKLIRKWIEEGAKFDGKDESASMATYARR